MTPPRELLPTVGDVGAGALLGRYELLLPVAEGGMAAVWAARLHGANGFQKLVALKSMLPELGQDPRFEEMFLAEATFASRIEHPHVAAILDLGEEKGNLFTVMEWVDGETLSALARALRPSGGVPLHLAARVILDAAAGLHAAHELVGDSGERLGLVHCDVSPQNIMITQTGVVKIVDFGVAKAAAEAPSQAGLVKGKASFMSPEQAAGEAIDRRTDVFALGVVAYEMITGQNPFRAESAPLTTARVRDPAPVTPPRLLNPGCPEGLSDAIARALEKDPARRFQTMTELAQAIERALAPLGGPGRREELAELVRAALGSRTDARRAAIREAMRVADDRAGIPSRRTTMTSTPPISIEIEPPPPTVAPRRRSTGLVAFAVAGVLVVGIGLAALAGVVRGKPSTVVASVTVSGVAPAAEIPPPPPAEPAIATPVEPVAPAVVAPAPKPVERSAPKATPSAIPSSTPSAAPRPSNVTLPTVRDPGF